MFDRLTAFNQRHKARAEEELENSHAVFKDTIMKSVLEAQNDFLPQFQAAIKTTYQALIKGGAENVAAKFTTLEKQLLQRHDNLQTKIDDQDGKLQPISIRLPSTSRTSEASCPNQMAVYERTLKSEMVG